MSQVIVKQIDDEGNIDASNLHEKYPSFCKDGVQIMSFVNRIFNNEKSVVLTPKISIEAPIKVREGYPKCKVDLSWLMTKQGIAKSYYVELIVTNFITKIEDRVEMVPIFPNEITLDCDYAIKEIIEKDVETLQKIGKSYEIIGILHHENLPHIAEDMREAIVRFERHDYDGAIKFFRKVAEGFKKFASNNTIESKNRTEALQKFLTKVYHLMSNFGEHAESSGAMDEAMFSKDVSIALSEYIIKKL